MEKLVGEENTYPSRSELIRVAVREFLIKELEAALSYKKQPEPKPIDQSLFVRVPVDGSSKEMEYKTFKIVKK